MDLLALGIAFEGSDLQAAVHRDWNFFAGGLAVDTYCVKMQMGLCILSSVLPGQEGANR